ncbi:maleylpyruvate isomerase family mycothiol-dependent enzyme [Actinomycetota bacterium Odt1-20B]
MSRPVDAMEFAREERAELAALLATLTPAQWNAPSLCAGWRVRDVIAHMFSYDGLGPLALIGRFVKGGILLDRVNTVGVAAFADRSTDELLALVAAHPRPRGLTAGFGGRVALTDAMIHQQDIRRPLGLPRTAPIPEERLRCVLQFATMAPPLRARKRIRGLTLSATDLDWRHGDGPVVTGTGEALLMGMAGRTVVVPELSGPGLPTLARRLRDAPA